MTNVERSIGIARSDQKILCHIVNISARYKHYKIALSISTTILTDVSADQVPSVLMASCSADRCESLGGLTLSHSEYAGEIQASQDTIVNQDYHLADVSVRMSQQTNYHRHLGHLVAPTDANLLVVLLCRTVNIPARYKHHKIALSIRTTI